MQSQKPKTVKMNSTLLAEPGRNDLPLDELLLRIALKDEDATGAADAFNSVYKLFKQYLNNVSYRYAAMFSLDDENRRSLFNNALIKLFEKAGNLLDIADKTNETEKRKIVAAWLGKVMQTEAVKMSKENTEYHGKISLKDNFEPANDDTANEDTDPPASISKGFDEEYVDEDSAFLNKIEHLSNEEQIVYEYTSPEMRCMNEILMSFKPATQQVLLKYYEYAEGRKHLPKEELESLCRDLNKLPDSILHIKHRGFEKLKELTNRLLLQKYPDYRVRGADDS